MSWTKRQLVEEAYAELALAGYEFDLSPDEMEAGLRRLDSLMATWDAFGIQIGYAIGTPSDSDLDQDAGIPLYACEAVYLALAIRLAPGKGKAIPSSTMRNHKAAYDALVSRLASSQVQEQQLASGTPRGAGRKPWRTTNRPFVDTPNTAPLKQDADGGLTFTGETN